MVDMDEDSKKVPVARAQSLHGDTWGASHQRPRKQCTFLRTLRGWVVERRPHDDQPVLSPLDEYQRPQPATAASTSDIIRTLR